MCQQYLAGKHQGLIRKQHSGLHGETVLFPDIVQPTYGAKEYQTSANTVLLGYRFTPQSSEVSEIHSLCQNNLEISKTRVGFESGNSRFAFRRATNGHTRPTCPNAIAIKHFKKKKYIKRYRICHSIRSLLTVSDHRLAVTPSTNNNFDNVSPVVAAIVLQQNVCVVSACKTTPQSQKLTFVIIALNFI